jgi:uroporphyrinogen-III decarboxylase
MPLHKKVNEWIHENTNWKILIHTCGSVVDLIPDLIETGFDAINPVQISAAGMDANNLKDEFGDKLVFWGGGANPQGTLISGTPEEVYEETKKNVEILGKDGGLIAGNVHNLLYNVPVENFLAEVQAIKDAKPNG